MFKLMLLFFNRCFACLFLYRFTPHTSFFDVSLSSFKRMDSLNTLAVVVVISTWGSFEISCAFVTVVECKLVVNYYNQLSVRLCIIPQSELYRSGQPQYQGSLQRCLVSELTKPFVQYLKRRCIRQIVS